MLFLAWLTFTALSSSSNAPSAEQTLAWPRASTYQRFLKLPPVIDVIHLVGPRQAQVVIIVHAGDAEAVLLFRRGALDELEQEKVECV